jgi:hypothetical protein
MTRLPTPAELAELEERQQRAASRIVSLGLTERESTVLERYAKACHVTPTAYAASIIAAWVQKKLTFEDTADRSTWGKVRHVAKPEPEKETR